MASGVVQHDLLVNVDMRISIATSVVPFALALCPHWKRRRIGWV